LKYNTRVDLYLGLYFIFRIISYLYNLYLTLISNYISILLTPWSTAYVDFQIPSSFTWHSLLFGSDAWHGDPDESADGHGAEQTGRPRRGKVGEASGSGGKRRSGIWQHFESVENNAKARCVDCGTVVKCGSDNGTSVLHNHRKSGKCKRTRGATDQPPNPPRW
jgi:hypothetical protein